MYLSGELSFECICEAARNAAIPTSSPIIFNILSADLRRLQSTVDSSPGSDLDPRRPIPIWIPLALRPSLTRSDSSSACLCDCISAFAAFIAESNSDSSTAGASAGGDASWVSCIICGIGLGGAPAAPKVKESGAEGGGEPAGPSPASASGLDAQDAVQPMPAWPLSPNEPHNKSQEMCWVLFGAECFVLFDELFALFQDKGHQKKARGRVSLRFGIWAAISVALMEGRYTQGGVC